MIHARISLLVAPHLAPTHPRCIVSEPLCDSEDGGRTGKGPAAAGACGAGIAGRGGITRGAHVANGNGLGVVANAHLAAGVADCPYLEFPFDPPEWSLARRDFVLTAPVAVDPQGWIVLADAPGFGVELDEARLARTRL